MPHLMTRVVGGVIQMLIFTDRGVGCVARAKEIDQCHTRMIPKYTTPLLYALSSYFYCYHFPPHRCDENS